MHDGLLNLPLWGHIAAVLALTHVTIAAVTIYLHRCQAHRALDLHPVVSHFFRFWLWLTTGMGTKEWVAVHRKHHAKVETEDDPHSPQIEGIRKVLLEGVELYRLSARDPEVLEKFGHGTPDDWLERNLYTRFPSLGIALMLALDLALFGVLGITIWAVQMLWIPFWAAGVINGLGHYLGYRNYEPQDASTNIVPIGLLIGGEEMHNNHHAFPSSAKFSSKWWELDIGWLYIRLLASVGLAKVKKVAPRPVVVPGKEAVDRETVRAVVMGRFHVMAHYGRDVILPVVRDELRRADVSCRHLFKQARRLMLREHTCMDDAAQHELTRALSESDRLETVYQFKLRLQGVWKRSAASHEHLVQALAEWCREAEASGIQALQRFARRLRGYTLAPAG